MTPSARGKRTSDGGRPVQVPTGIRGESRSSSESLPCADRVANRKNINGHQFTGKSRCTVYMYNYLVKINIKLVVMA